MLDIRKCTHYENTASTVFDINNRDRHESVSLTLGLNIHDTHNKHTHKLLAGHLGSDVCNVARGVDYT